MISKEAVYNRLRLVDDPELGLNLVDLGLICGVDVDGGSVVVHMTLTTRGCPLHDAMLPAIEHVVGQIEGVDDITVDLVWEPPWTPERLTPLGAAALGWNRG
jgi:metal-sulfur cluster biosynthetic enzyme